MSVSAMTALAIGGAVSQGVGSIADTANSALQAHYNRELSREENAKNREFTHQENALAREWQERMSNTAYQRTVADMEKAGLNKMLAYGANPANITASSGTTNSSLSAQGNASSNFREIGYGLVESAKLNARELQNKLERERLDVERTKIDVQNAQKIVREYDRQGKLYHTTVSSR